MIFEAKHNPTTAIAVVRVVKLCEVAFGGKGRVRPDESLEFVWKLVEEGKGREARDIV